MKILVTGAAGFVGMHTAQALLARGDEVVGLDNLNDYYDPVLKQARLDQLAKYQGANHAGFHFVKMDVADTNAMLKLAADEKFDAVVHLAAQAGVRYSLQNPLAYVQANLVGFVNVLEACRHNNVKHLVFASSSSVYGGNARMPFAEADAVDHPVSLYAATKKSNELLAHTYSHLYGLPTTGLRFFTVYGPWGRPDMALFKFTRAIIANEPIDVYGHGQQQRDFTYIDDIVHGVVATLDAIPNANPSFDRMHPDAATSWAPYRVFNIGNHQPVDLMDFIVTLEQSIGKTAQKNMLPMQPGDVSATYAETSRLEQAVGFAPKTPLVQGIANFVQWYRSYYGV